MLPKGEEKKTRKNNEKYTAGPFFS